MSRFVVQTTSFEETIALGRDLAAFLHDGDALILTGDLGAGKTQLTKGIAAGLGCTSEITSPTFTIEMVHTGGRLELHHFDLYRLDDADELEDTGIFDVLGVEGVCVVEWGEQFIEQFGDEYISVVIERVAVDQGTSSEDEPARRIVIEDTTPRGAEVAQQLAASRGGALEE